MKVLFAIWPECRRRHLLRRSSYPARNLPRFLRNSRFANVLTKIFG